MRTSIAAEAFQQVAQQVLERALAGKSLRAFGTEGRGLWGRHAEEREYPVLRVEVPYADPDSEPGFVSLNIWLEGYGAHNDGLVYTDATFLHNLRALLEEAGLNGAAVVYSEQGMQGEGYVNLDVSFKVLTGAPSAAGAKGTRGAADEGGDHADPLPARIDTAAATAESEFWEAVAKAFPEVKTGDLSPDVAMVFSAACQNVIRAWVRSNIESSGGQV